MDTEKQNSNKRKKKDKINLSSLPKDKLGILLSVNMFEIKESILKLISNVENFKIDEIESQQSIEKFKSNLNSSLSSTLKKMKNFSNNISELYDIKMTDKDIANLYEVRKFLSKVSTNNLSDFMEILIEKE